MAQIVETPEAASVSDGVTASFTIPFTYVETAEVQVWVLAADGTRTAQVEDVDYVITGSSGAFLSGKIPASGARVERLRRTPAAQPEAFGDDASFRPQANEQSFDKAVRLVQEVRAQADRAVTVPLGEAGLDVPPVDARKGYVAEFDAVTGKFKTGTSAAALFAAAAAAASLASLALLNAVEIGPKIAAEATEIPATLTAVRTTGYYGPDGRGAALYARIGAEPAHAGKFQDAAGAWWELIEERITPFHFGAVGHVETNDTDAVEDAQAFLHAKGGGELFFPRTDTGWKFNAHIVHDNIRFVGEGGGRAEWNERAIFPADLTKPVITVGNGVDVTRFWSLTNLHIAGTDGTVDGATKAANNCPACIRLGGGSAFGTIDNVVLFNGLKTLDVRPSLTGPATIIYVGRFQLRQDIEDSADADALYMLRVAGGGDLSYTTAIYFSEGHISGPASGYSGRFDGIGSGISCNFTNVYVDCDDGHGFLVTGGSQLIASNLYLDGGAGGAVVLETDGTTRDPSRVISGNMRSGGGVMKNSLDQLTTLPGEGEWFTAFHRLHKPYLSDEVYITTALDPYDDSIKLSLENVGGPFKLSGADWHVGATTQATDLTNAASVIDGGQSIVKDNLVGGSLFVFGGLSSRCGVLTAATGSGGVLVGAYGANQPVDLQPAGTGRVRVGGAGLEAAEDGVQSCGWASKRFSEVFAATGTINTSDAREKTAAAEDLIDPDTDLLTPLGQRIAARVPFAGFQWNDALAEKGPDGARIHFGWYAQAWAEAFAAEGLDAARYALFCSDPAWEPVVETRVSQVQRTETVELPFVEIVVEDGQPIQRTVMKAIQRGVVEMVPVIDEAGQPVMKPVSPAHPGRPARRGREAIAPTPAVFEPLMHPVPVMDEVEQTFETLRPRMEADGETQATRLGLRMDQCAVFMMAALATRLAALEAA